MHTEAHNHDSFDQSADESLVPKQISAWVLEYVLTQYTLNKDLKLYVKHATKKELKQLHDIDIFEPVDINSLTENERKTAIASLTFLTITMDGTIKA